MLACLPLIALVLLFLIFCHFQSDWRGAILSAAIAWGTLITIFTEVLSLVWLLTFSTVSIAWILTIISLSVIYFRLQYQKSSKLLNKIAFSKLTPVSLTLLGGIFLIVATVGIVALISPPNNWDSMTYHMARVVHWIQNRSVAHYPTYYSAQLVHPPFAEYIIMHLQILSGGDRFANLVQWSCMVGSIIGVSLIAKQLGANQQGQVLAAVFCATISMGILQASSTQNDYVVAFGLVCLAHYILLTLPYKNPPIHLVLGIAFSLGLTLLIKSSAYIFAFPFMVWLLIWYLPHLKWKFWKPFCIVMVIVLLLNGGHYLRNLDLYGSPITGGDYVDDYKMEVYSFQTFISNILRNLSLHVDIVRHFNLQGFITPITGIVQKLILIIHNLLGVDVNDPRTTHPPGAYRVPGLSFGENTAGNPLHLILIAIATVIFFIRNKHRNNRIALYYFLTLLGGFLLFCLLFKIQIYHSRHHLSLFVLFAPIVGLTFTRYINKYIYIIIATLLLITSLQFVFCNKLRPIYAGQNIFNTSREELYFNDRKFLAKPYIEAANFLKNQDCTNIGLSLGDSPTKGGGEWEYPLWVLIKTNDKGQIFRFQHFPHPDTVAARKSQEHPYKDFSACAILATRTTEEENNRIVDRLVFNNMAYIRKWASSPVTVLFKQSKAQKLQKSNNTIDRSIDN